ncbi:MAG: fibronectin type III domain-containing protein [Candidatus Cyclobacteriaceae bacterium M3_2C_046]
MKTKLVLVAALILGLTFININSQAQPRAYQAPEFEPDWSHPGRHPDHVILTFSGDPATTMSVTWRTDTTVGKGFAEIAPATAAPKFWRNARTYQADTEFMDASQVLTAEIKANYHSVTFTDLMPDTLYAYRVGNGKIWSEWFQFRTASKEPKSFSFLYLGDTQNYILELWSRLVREGYRKAPDARFIIHAGDLVNDAHSERQWHEWFTAGGWINGMIPSIPVPGNHEYEPYRDEREQYLSVQWQPQFTLPRNGPEGLSESVYYVDYQDLRILGLNSSEKREEQAVWINQVMQDNTSKWTVATFHHPLFSASEGRDNERLRNLWKPLFDQHKIDLVLQGHDHTYARGTTPATATNVMQGVNARDRETGTVYVVSVSGGKMYDLKESWDMYEANRERKAENTQLFQLVHINGDTLSYEAYTAVGELYDAFDLVKQEGKPNLIIDRSDQTIAERMHHNTIHYEDQLPEDFSSKLKAKYNGYKIDGVRYIDDPQFQGYRVELEHSDHDLHIFMDMDGEIVREEKDD